MRRLSFSLLLLTLVAPIGCTDAPAPQKAKDTDKIQPKDGSATVELGALPTGPIAVVAGVEIPNEKFAEIYNLKVQKYAERGRDIPATADRRYRKSIAERLIWNEVLAQEATKLKVEYDKAELEKREQQQKRGIRDWDKHLERRGETEVSLREMYTAELREQAILEKQGALEVSVEEVKEDYDKIKGNWEVDKPRVRASHILVPIGPAQAARSDKKAEPTAEEQKKYEDEAKVEIDSIYKLILADPAKFEDIAQEHSTGPSATKGGDIGIFTHDRMAEEFSETAFAQDVGKISEPVKTKFGWHIIKVTGKWPPGELPMDALEDQIRDRLRQRKLHQGRRKLKETLMASYEITDNIAATLGPEPARRRPTRPEAGDDPHGGAARKKLGGKGADSKATAKEAVVVEHDEPAGAGSDG